MTIRAHWAHVSGEARDSSPLLRRRSHSQRASGLTALCIAPVPELPRLYSHNILLYHSNNIGTLTKATPRNDMKKPHHLPISANCGGESAYFRCMGKPNQAGKQRLSARIRFASANNIFNFAVCFRRPRYRVFRYRNRPFTTPKTCSTFARTDDFSCSLRFN